MKEQINYIVNNEAAPSHMHLLNTLKLLIMLLLVLPMPSRAADGVTAGQFVVEPPTLINLGFEWPVKGDDNRNAKVTVAYRATGTTEWKEAQPLLRIGGERVFRETEFVNYVTPDMFAGSILDLNPDTEYECRFTMTDADGLQGEAVKTVKVRTRREPKAAADGRVLHVYPENWTGAKIEPSFTGLKRAYYGSGTGDWSVVSERTVGPGDILVVHAGLYRADRYDYVNPEGVPFDGTYTLTAKGTEERPIVIRAAGDGEVIFDGAGTHILFDVMATQHHIFEGITIKNADIAFSAGVKQVAGASYLTIRQCRMENVGEGITTEFAGSKNFNISDNILIGRDDRYRLNGWAAGPKSLYGSTPIYSYIGIRVYGSGHVIAHNAVAYFHDAIDVSTYGSPEASQDLKAVSIDILNNDIHLMADDFIESDGGVYNIRIMRNRGVNAAQCGLSAQPVYGGPAYFIRNVLYNIPTGCAIKSNAKPAGLFFYHNTIIAENSNNQTFSNGHFRNNLILGTNTNRSVAVFPMATAYSTYDYDGYRPNSAARSNYVWIFPPNGQLRDYSATPTSKSFTSLQSFSQETGLEKNGIEIDYDIFQNLAPPDPKTKYAVYHATDLNFQLQPRAKAVNAGVRLPNVNDNFTGKAPDLGAIESGEKPPVYGPRGRNADQSFYR